MGAGNCLHKGEQMQRGFEYNQAVGTCQEEISHADDDALIMLALSKLLIPVENMMDLPSTTALMRELEKRGNRKPAVTRWVVP
jgi:hypothetical protein